MGVFVRKHPEVGNQRKPFLQQSDGFLFLWVGLFKFLSNLLSDKYISKFFERKYPVGSVRQNSVRQCP